MKVKICGIKTVEEAERACILKPDAIGILVGYNPYSKPNRIKEEVVKEIVNKVQNSIDTFILTETTDAKSNISYCKNIGNNYLQLTADICPEEIRKIKTELPYVRNVKVIHVTGKETLCLARLYEDCESVDELLLDSRTVYKRGGTGVVHDWETSQRIRSMSKKPVWLAGGLNIGNIRDAIASVRPYGMDVETGVQNKDGSKNYELIKQFISIAKSY